MKDALLPTADKLVAGRAEVVVGPKLPFVGHVVDVLSGNIVVVSLVVLEIAVADRMTKAGLRGRDLSRRCHEGLLGHVIDALASNDGSKNYDIADGFGG